MFSSKEIRWFTKNEDKVISIWFSQKKIDFNNAATRTDFYLPLPGKEDIGIKLREGNIEIKHRIAEPEKGQFSKNTQGYFERYTKWSFSTPSDDLLTRQIIHEKRYDWLEVKKERMGLKLKEETNGKIDLLPIDRQIDYGCQIEYTRITINNRTWFTFGLEWFGEKELKVDSELLNDILGNTVFNIGSSMGYAEFLNKGIFKD
ncbi:hypothetical protein [Gramella sp. KN1008]|uniref:hypothetical protein n=1 Tax=Gramella sp. KN1008 TaxID=2529298 RepID=UPI00103B763E|nr:hypothetical protein [Gramella sp. KN1008]TBW25783.1 hypothetical protein EZJ28_15350 [Gramella sp. KN1008]